MRTTASPPSTPCRSCSPSAPAWNDGRRLSHSGRILAPGVSMRTRISGEVPAAKSSGTAWVRPRSGREAKGCASPSVARFTTFPLATS
jgi:hypothetical protein